jgi:signal transduction histidine kinase
MKLVISYNGDMNRERKGEILLILLIFFITASATVLGVLQYRWTWDVSETEENRLRRSLFSATAQVMQASKEEILIPLALFRMENGEYEEKAWTRFRDSYAFWKSNARFPRLITSVYIVEPGEKDLRTLRYNEGSASFEPIPAPEFFSALKVPDKQPPDDKESRELRLSLIRQGLVLEPLRSDSKERGEEGEKNPGRFLALHIDLSVLFAEVIPYYMDEYLYDYPYRVLYTDQASGRSEVKLSSAVIRDYWVPDAVIPLSSLLKASDPFPRDDRPLLSDAKGDSGPERDVSIRVWLSRSERDDETEARFRAEDSEIGVLHVFYPGGPIHSLIKARRMANLGISIGLLLLLSACMLVLGKLYKNTLNLRAVEQEFVSSMSHELRTPIAVLQSTAENLKSGLVSDPSKVSRYGEVMYKETKRLSRMVEGILLYSGLEQRKQQNSQFESIDLKSLVAEVNDALKEPALKAQAVISVQLNPAIGTVSGDPKAIRLILENLLMNAIYHGLPSERSPEKPAVIRLIMEPRVLNRGFSITVEDEGPGIPQGEAKKVFEPFVRGEASIRGQHPGSGLGLHLAKRITELLGGTVRLESPYLNTIGRSQQGCRFIVELPAVRGA